MAYRVELAARAARDLRAIYRSINAQDSAHARRWFDELAALVGSLDRMPSRGGLIPEGGTLRQLLHGRKPHIYRVIYTVDDQRHRVVVVHIRHGARQALEKD